MKSENVERSPGDIRAYGLTHLDKGIPFKEIVMRHGPPADCEIPEPRWPAGFSFHTYESGDMDAWADIESSVDEFADHASAVVRFTREFLPHEDELRRRMVFVADTSGRLCATACAWTVSYGGVRRALVHWVGVMPDVQGLGLARAMTAWVLRRFAELHPGEEIYLRTQTWSHKAIGLYLRMGFRPTDERHAYLAKYNEYSEARKVLAGVMPSETLAMFTPTFARTGALS